MISVKHSGDFDKVTRFLNKMKKNDAVAILNSYGEKGVKLLQQSTPKRTGKTAASWSYEVEASKGNYVIYWSNSNVNNGINIAIILQYGHGTKNGGYVKGIDYINPVTKQIFEEMADDLWKEVVNS